VIDTIELVRITEEPLVSSGSAFCTVNSRPRTFVLKVLSKCSSLISPSVPNSYIPAFTASTSMRPACAWISAKMRSRLARLVVSPWIAAASPPIAATAASSWDWRRPVIKHVRVFLRETLRNTKANAGAAADDDSDFVCELAGHRDFLLRELLRRARRHIDEE
jgi:hypothetical protein